MMARTTPVAGDKIYGGHKNHLKHVVDALVEMAANDYPDNQALIPQNRRTSRNIEMPTGRNSDNKWEGGAESEEIKVGRAQIIYRLDLQGFTAVKSDFKGELTHLNRKSYANWQIQFGTGSKGKTGGTVANVLMETGIIFSQGQFKAALMESAENAPNVACYLTYA
jgi:hypothetical protein